MKNLDLDYDPSGDVLYVKVAGARIRAGRPVEGDDFVILNVDQDGVVVGLQLIDAREMSAVRWREYFATPEIPEEIFAAVDAWLQKNVGNSGKMRASSRVTPAI